MQRIRRRALLDLSLSVTAVMVLAATLPRAGRETETSVDDRASSLELSVRLPAIIYAQPDSTSVAIRSVSPATRVTIAWGDWVVDPSGRVWVRALAPAVGWLLRSAIGLPGGAAAATP
jgi:hypothetical protein